MAPPPSWHYNADGTVTCDDCALFRGVEQPATGATQPPPVSPEPAPAIIDLSTSIELRSGAYLNLADPDCSVIQPIDVAAGLRQARFSAQTGQFYTIAQHSVLVLRLVERSANAVGGQRGLALKRCALMHDAAEAFIHDITRPLKILLPDYRAIEAVLERRLAERFGLEWTSGRRQQIKRADMEALAIEKRDVLRSRQRWPVIESIAVETLERFSIPRAWHPDEAQDRFLSAFADLFPAETERKAA
jgi:hypothetical protein